MDELKKVMSMTKATLMIQLLGHYVELKKLGEVTSAEITVLKNSIQSVLSKLEDK